MMNITFNGAAYTMPEGITILEAAQQTQRSPIGSCRDVRIPTLYYYKGLVDVDNSGVCVVEANGELVNASSTPITEGMAIVTESPELLAARKEAVTRIMAIHDYDCNHCVRTTCCELQALVKEYELTEVPTLPKEAFVEPDTTSPVFVRDNNKCIRCGRCVQVCGKVQGIAAIGAEGEGLSANIGMLNNPFAASVGLGGHNCSNCGQCVAVCPVGALYEKDGTAQVCDALADPEKFVVAQVAPAVRTALGESFGFPMGVDVEGKLPAALRILGFDRVFDTKLAADLTVVEEAHELVERVQNGGTLPLMTSCCPGWVKYCENYYPELLDNLSTCKSPQSMFGAVVKSYLAEKLGLDRSKVVVVSIMPCTAKKYEIARPELDGDVDISITTNELARLLRKNDIQLEALDSEAFDDPLGRGTGAGVIFGATGGVMEAALRTASAALGGEEPKALAFTEVRGMEGVKEAQYEIGGVTLKVAAVSGLANAGKLMDAIRKGESGYHMIEVMACPGGCVGGGGQPHQSAAVRALSCVAGERAAVLYRSDEKSAVRKSHENPAVQSLYRDYLGDVGGEKAHALLHTGYTPR